MAVRRSAFFPRKWAARTSRVVTRRGTNVTRTCTAIIRPMALQYSAIASAIDLRQAETGRGVDHATTIGVDVIAASPAARCRCSGAHHPELWNSASGLPPLLTPPRDQVKWTAGVTHTGESATIPTCDRPTNRFSGPTPKTTCAFANSSLDLPTRPMLPARSLELSPRKWVLQATRAGMET